MLKARQDIPWKFQRVVRALTKRTYRLTEILRGIPLRETAPFSTHVPVLAAVPFVRNVRRVLELGSGLHSTLTFLDPEVFPDLQQLHTFENDPKWAETVLIAAGGDPRLSLEVVPATVAGSLGRIDFARYDLVFVDDSQSLEAREKTLRRLADLYSPKNLVVVHDFERLRYRWAVRSIPHRFVFSALNPNTGLLWDAPSIDRRTLARVNALIRDGSRTEPIPSAKTWTRLYRNELRGKGPHAIE